MSNSVLSQAAAIGGRETHKEKTRVVSTRRRVPTNCVSGMTLQPSTDTVVAMFYVEWISYWMTKLEDWRLCTPSHLKRLQHMV